VGRRPAGPGAQRGRGDRHAERTDLHRPGRLGGRALSSRLSPLRLEPQRHERVWGGRRFTNGDNPIGQLWIVWEQNPVVGGQHDGRTLGELAAELGEALIGTARHERKFPLLIKLLDTREWLSVQVHPDDARAVELEGEGYVGKTEAWHVLDAEPDARVIA